jgi:predicted TIM-barrel fold metal-dependent hydrolase
MAHLGSPLFRREAAEMVMLHPNVYFDLAGCGNFLALSPKELADLIRYPYYQVDPTFRNFDKMILGSDAYLTVPQILSDAQIAYRHLMERIGLPQTICDKIMGQTVASWLER